MHSNKKLSTAITMILMGVIGSAHAVCSGPTPMDIGPHNPVTTFPLWVQDSQALALEICPGTDQLNCISVPPFTAADFPGDPNATAKGALSQQIGFGDEGFWASSDALLTIPASGALATPGRAVFVFGVEAAFLPDFADGNQFPFTRMRIRIDVPQAGTYTVTHPWGQIEYVITDPGIRAINDSFDIPFVADQQGYRGRIGSLLTWDTFPDDPLLDQYGPPFTYTPPYGASGPDGIADYIGLPTVDHAVKGSPCGTNFVRIDGPDIGGTGVNSIETNLFTVSGKIYNGPPLPTPLQVDQLSYNRSAFSGRVDVFANAPSASIVTFSADPNLPVGEHPMTGDGSGRFFGQMPLTPDTATLPPTVQVTATNLAVAPASNPAIVDIPLVDQVTISRADYDLATSSIIIEAGSSDLRVPPTLTAFGQPLVNGTLTTFVSTVPASVTVTSSAGGSATFPVSIIHP